MVGRRAGGLDDEDVRAADVLVDLHERFAVRKGRDGRLAERHADALWHISSASARLDDPENILSRVSLM